MKTKTQILAEVSAEIIDLDINFHRAGANKRFVNSLDEAKRQQAFKIEKHRLAHEGLIDKKYYLREAEEVKPYNVNTTYVSSDLLEQESIRLSMEGWKVVIDTENSSLLIS